MARDLDACKDHPTSRGVVLNEAVANSKNAPIRKHGTRDPQAAAHAVADKRAIGHKK